MSAPKYTPGRWADLLVACKGALAALTQPKTFPADVEAAKAFLAAAIAKAGAR